MTVDINDEIYIRFQEYCKKNGFVIRDKLRIVIENFLEEKE